MTDSTQPGVFASRGYPTKRFWKQRGLNTFAVEWQGDNIGEAHDFIVMRLKYEDRDKLELFVTRDQTLLAWLNDCPQEQGWIIPRNNWLVDQNISGTWGWVPCDAERFHHLYEEIDPHGD